jgi:SH3-like domain-containing protein
MKTSRFSHFGLLIAGLLAVTLSGPPVYAQSDQYKEAFTAYQTQDFGKAERLWKELAQQGNPNAQYALGVMSLRAEAGDSGKEQAFQWFQQAAAQGHSTAMFNLGVAYWDGSGVAQNKEKALEWWEESAAAGDSGAQFNLGLAYFIGDVRPSDLDIASKWIGMAAEQNHPEAKRIYKIIQEDGAELSISGLQGSGTESGDIVESEATGITESTTVSSGEIGQEPGMQVDQAGSVDQPGIEPVPEQEPVPEPTPEPEPLPEFEYWKLASDSVLRTTPQNSGAVFDSLGSGTPIEITDSRGEWYLITLPDGLKMWIFEDYLEVTGDSGTVRGTGVRVRPKPTTDNFESPPAGAYRNGEQVIVVGKEGQWYQVRAPKRIGGWVPVSAVEKYFDTEPNRRELWELMLSKGL